MSFLFAGYLFFLAAEAGEAGAVGYCVTFSVLGTLLTAAGCFRAYFFLQELREARK